MKPVSNFENDTKFMDVYLNLLTKYSDYIDDTKPKEEDIVRFDYTKNKKGREFFKFFNSHIIHDLVIELFPNLNHNNNFEDDILLRLHNDYGIPNNLNEYCAINHFYTSNIDLYQYLLDHMYGVKSKVLPPGYFFTILNINNSLNKEVVYSKFKKKNISEQAKEIIRKYDNLKPFTFEVKNNELIVFINTQHLFIVRFREEALNAAYLYEHYNKIKSSLNLIEDLRKLYN